MYPFSLGLSLCLIAIAIIPAIAYLGVCLFLWLRQTRFIFEPAREIDTTPACLGLNYEEVWLPIPSQNGEVKYLHGWWIPGSSPDAETILYLHGNKSNISGTVCHAPRFLKLGFSVLLIDYRGFGRSHGKFPNEARVYEDAEIAWNYLVTERKIKPQQIFIYGHSLGGAIAIELASRQPNAGGVVVECSFTCLRDMVERGSWFSWFPINLILHQRFDSIEKIKNLKVPVLLIHGTADRRVPPAMSQQLFDAAPEPKQLFFVADATHTQVADVAGDRYLQVLRDFADKVKAFPQSS